MGSMKRKATYSSKSSKRRRTAGKKAEPDAILSKYTPTKVGLIPGLPRLFKFKHRYVTKHNLTSSAGVVQEIVFRANGMYDPDFTATGHQPMYFDQFSLMYNHFYVLRSKIKFTVVPEGTSIQAPYRLTGQVKDVSSGGLSADEAAEQNGSISRVCTGGVNPSKEVITLYYDAQRQWGNNLLSNSRMRGSASADPSEQTFFHLDLVALNGSSTVNTHVLVEIIYEAIWDERKAISGS